MAQTILRTRDEKVQFFRNLLLGTATHVRIIIGGDESRKMEALRQAVDDIGPQPANEICVIGDDPDYYMPVQEPRDRTTIFIYSYLYLTDEITDELCAAEAESCEIVVFEHDPQIDPIKT